MMRRFEKADLAHINKWNSLRGTIEFESSQLPVFGYIVEHTAVGFLMQTDTSNCIFDGFLTNPLAQGDLRHIALKEIIAALIDMAKMLKFKKIYAFTNEDSIVHRAFENSFVKSGEFRLLIKEL